MAVPQTRSTLHLRQVERQCVWERSVGGERVRMERGERLRMEPGIGGVGAFGGVGSHGGVGLLYRGVRRVGGVGIAVYFTRVVVGIRLVPQNLEGLLGCIEADL